MTKRTFISVDIPEHIKNEITLIQSKLPQFKGKITEKQNLHLTLKFLGELSDNKINDVDEKLSSIRFDAFNAEINHLGVFSKEYIKIIWLNVDNCDHLQQMVDECLSPDFEKEKRFMGHLTIARVKSLNKPKIFLKNLYSIPTDKIIFKVNKINLNESILSPKGPIYKVIKEYPQK